MQDPNHVKDSGRVWGPLCLILNRVSDIVTVDPSCCFLQTRFFLFRRIMLPKFAKSRLVIILNSIIDSENNQVERY